MSVIISRQYYDIISQSYEIVRRERERYLSSIERAIVDELSPFRDLNILDIGTGDAARLRTILKHLSTNRVVAIDESEAQLARAREILPHVEFIQSKAESYVPERGCFDAVFCLWNVLGHIPTLRGALKALRTAHNALCDGGLVFVDVNNRYNVHTYGLRNAAKNVLKDIRECVYRNGEFLTSRPGMHGGKNGIFTPVHIFNPYETRRLFRAAGFSVIKERTVCYDTGKTRWLPFLGQKYYVLQK